MPGEPVLRPVDDSDVISLNARLAEAGSLDARMLVLKGSIAGRIAFSTSLGKEDQAILHALSATGCEADIFTLDTGRLFPETLDTVERSERRYGVRIRLIAPDAAELQALVARDGVLGFRYSVAARLACCDVRKVRPLKRTLAGAAAWVTGMRRDQWSSRADLPLAAWDGEYRLIKVNPLADWSADRLEHYICEHNVPVNPLHERGFASIGCQPCTRAIAPGEHPRAGRWWWEQEDGKECGLHSSRRQEAAA
jgi:phosphoadenosine phosphosulfate reductase